MTSGKTLKRVTFDTVRRGWHVVDEYNQVCRVERVSREHREMRTMRRDAHGWWDAAAVWTQEAFDCRGWRRVSR